jgi:hypothetical protein
VTRAHLTISFLGIVGVRAEVRVQLAALDQIAQIATNRLAIHVELARQG